MRNYPCQYQCLQVMFVALSIEGFAEVERLLPCSELDFHRPTGAVDRGQLSHVRLCFAQIGQHEMPAIADEAFRTRILAAIAGFFATFSPPGRCDFRGRPHGDEATLLALLSDDCIDVDDISLEALEVFLQGCDHPLT